MTSWVSNIISVREICIFSLGMFFMWAALCNENYWNQNVIQTSSRRQLAIETKALPSMREVYENYNHEAGFHHWMNYAEHYDTNLAP